MAKTTQAQPVRGLCTPEQPGSNVIPFRRKTAPAPATLSARADKGRKEALDDIFDALGQLSSAFRRYSEDSAVKKHEVFYTADGTQAVGEALASVVKSALDLKWMPVQKGGAA